MQERINNDIKDAMKKREQGRLDALRFMKSKLIENNTSKAPKADLDVIIAHYKTLKDSIDTFPEGDKHREQIAIELKFIEPYMPKSMDENEVKNIIRNIISAMPSPNMGIVMKELSPQIKGRFDGKRANELVKELLTAPC